MSTAPTYVTSLVSQISAAVVARLAAASYPPLVAGQILLGEQHLGENDAPPKIVLVPHSSRFSSKDITTATPLLTATPYGPEKLIQISSRPVLTDEFTFEVHCWATTSNRTNPAGVPDDDYNFARALYHALIASCDDLARGVYVAEPGRWTPSGVIALGREFVFGLTFMTPVLSELLLFVPQGTVGQAIIVPDGSTADSVVVPLG